MVACEMVWVCVSGNSTFVLVHGIIHPAARGLSFRQSIYRGNHSLTLKVSNVRLFPLPALMIPPAHF